MDNMNEDGICSMRKFYTFPSSEIDEGDDDTITIKLKISSLIAGSESFRTLILNMTTDPIYCTLVDTHLADLVSPKQLKFLSRGIAEIKVGQVGSTIYSSKSCHQEWFVLISGKLRIKQENSSEGEFLRAESSEDLEIWKGEIFGGYDFFEMESDQNHFDIVAIEQCTYVELKGLILEELLEEDPDVATDVYDMLGIFLFCCL
jgi:CRP-like cAMP-binding protein